MKTTPEQARAIQCADDWMRVRGLATYSELLSVARSALLLRQLGGMLPGSREIVQMIVEGADAAVNKVDNA